MAHLAQLSLLEQNNGRSWGLVHICGQMEHKTALFALGSLEYEGSSKSPESGVFLVGVLVRNMLSIREGRPVWAGAVKERGSRSLG